ncbi:hypothetical protein OKW96_20445 [Sphingobacterium sp. KU25419]|nr:hypothetical protein OKW96_20445 [Sphingobacterium sp. KU25419]
MIDVLHTYYFNQSTKKNTEVTKLEDLSSISDIQSVKNIVEYLDKSRIVIDKLKKLFENVQDQNVKSILLKDEFINTITNSNSQFKENRKKLQSDLQLLIDRQASN